MKKISGYVLVKETNVGVPNLVIAAYDSELALLDCQTEEMTAQSIQRIGKRMSSVLTDQDGKFVFASEELLEFQGNDARPDLLIIVFSPEDIQDISRPYPLSPEKRILYISSVPRAEAGAEEAFIIRLSQAQINKFQIPTTSRADESEATVNRLAAAIEDSLDFRDAMKTRLEPRFLEEQRRFENARVIAKDMVKNLSAIPHHLRDNDLLIKDKQGLKDSLQRLQNKVVTEGLDRLSKVSYRPTLRLRLTAQQVSDLGLKVDGQQISGQVDAEQLAKAARSLMNGVDLVRLRELRTPPLDELERKYLSNQSENDDAPPIS